jgi:hypothetical protein
MYHCSFQVKPQILDHDFSVCQKKQFRKYVNTFEFEVLCLVRAGDSSAGAHLLHLPYSQCQDQARGSSQPNVCLPIRQQSTKCLFTNRQQQTNQAAAANQIIAYLIVWLLPNN